MSTNEWWIYQGDGSQHPVTPTLPPPPKWRRFKGGPLVDRVLTTDPDDERGRKYQASDEERELINAAIFLRRPLLLTGKPGTGKSTVAYSIAYELNLGSVLHWPITTRSTLQDGLYRYDAIARLQEASLRGVSPDVGRFIRLGPLGTALLPAARPRVLLIDEIDKSDIDFPNDLLNIFEEGQFEIPELTRLTLDTDPASGAGAAGSVARQESASVLPYDGDDPVPIVGGRVRCYEFPIVIMTSNDEREFPPPLLRRCLRHRIKQPPKALLTRIVEARIDLEPEERALVDRLIDAFLERRDAGDPQELATDQLLNAVYMVTRGIDPLDRAELLAVLLKPLAASADEENWDGA